MVTKAFLALGRKHVQLRLLDTYAAKIIDIRPPPPPYKFPPIAQLQDGP